MSLAAIFLFGVSIVIHSAASPALAQPTRLDALTGPMGLTGSACMGGKIYFDGACRSSAWLEAKFGPALPEGYEIEHTLGNRKRGGSPDLVLFTTNEYNVIIYHLKTSATKMSTFRSRLAGYEIVMRLSVDVGVDDRQFDNDMIDQWVERNGISLWSETVLERPIMPILSLPDVDPRTESANIWQTEQRKILAWSDTGTASLECDGTESLSCTFGYASGGGLDCDHMVDTVLRNTAVDMCLVGLSAGGFVVGGLVGTYTLKHPLAGLIAGGAGAFAVFTGMEGWCTRRFENAYSPDDLVSLKQRCEDVNGGGSGDDTGVGTDGSSSGTSGGEGSSSSGSSGSSSGTSSCVDFTEFVTEEVTDEDGTPVECCEGTAYWDCEEEEDGCVCTQDADKSDITCEDGACE